jgi:hypothetical protein
MLFVNMRLSMLVQPKFDQPIAERAETCLSNCTELDQILTIKAQSPANKG